MARTYHKDEIEYEEQVLDDSHSAPHFDRSVLLLDGGETFALSEDENLGDGHNARDDVRLRDYEFGCPTPTEIPFKRRFARHKYDGGARNRPKLAEGRRFAVEGRASDRAQIWRSERSANARQQRYPACTFFFYIAK